MVMFHLERVRPEQTVELQLLRLGVARIPQTESRLGIIYRGVHQNHLAGQIVEEEVAGDLGALECRRKPELC